MPARASFLPRLEVWSLLIVCATVPSRGELILNSAAFGNERGRCDHAIMVKYEQY